MSPEERTEMLDWIATLALDPKLMLWATAEQMVLSLTGNRNIESLEQIMWWPLTPQEVEPA